MSHDKFPWHKSTLLREKERKLVFFSFKYLLDGNGEWATVLILLCITVPSSSLNISSSSWVESGSPEGMQQAGRFQKSKRGTRRDEKKNQLENDEQAFFFSLVFSWHLSILDSAFGRISRRRGRDMLPAKYRPVARLVNNTQIRFPILFVEAGKWPSCIRNRCNHRPFNSWEHLGCPLLDSILGMIFVRKWWASEAVSHWPARVEVFIKDETWQRCKRGFPEGAREVEGGKRRASSKGRAEQKSCACVNHLCVCCAGAVFFLSWPSTLKLNYENCQMQGLKGWKTFVSWSESAINARINYSSLKR